MNMITMAKDSILELAEMLRQSNQARMAFEARRSSPAPQPYRTQVVATGAGMVRVVEVGTGRVLGFRRSITEARWLAQALEGKARQVTA
jgi:hypothetical protein